MMDLRTRSLKEVNNSSSTASKRRAMSAASSPSSGELAAMGVGQQQKLGLWLRLKRETWLMGAAALRLVKGQGSSLAYLLIPAFISLLWLLVCMLTTKAPSLTLEERFAQKHLRELFEGKVYERGQIEITEERHEPIVMAEGESVNVVLAMPFLDVNPLGATEYISTLEWILIYTTVPVTFHVITNTDSVNYVEKIFNKVSETTGTTFERDIVTLADIMEMTTKKICPRLTVSEEFCDILMGKMTPLLFPYLFPHLDHAIYVDRNMMFQEDIGQLYQIVQKMKRSKEALALAPEQTNTYMRAFSAWQRLNPTTKLGRPPPDGKPGLNPDLILLDLEKLRASATYRSYFSERKLNKLVNNYLYHSAAEIPSLGDMVNLMAASSESLFLTLSCEWNRNSRSPADLLDRKYNVCPPPSANAGAIGRVRAWNGNPGADRARFETPAGGTGSSVSVGKKRLLGDEGNELRKR